MTKYRYAVRRSGARVHCEGCGITTSTFVAHATWFAHRHAATCESLHRKNWAACCPNCKQYGKVAPACPVCLGRGWIAEREGLS